MEEEAEVTKSVQQMAEGAVNNLPAYFEWIKHIDMLFALGVFAVIAIAFYTIAREMVVTVVIGVAFAFLIAYFTPVLSYIPDIGEIPRHFVDIGAFALLSLLIARFLFTNPFFEPMNVPTGKETLFFALVTAGFFITLALTWWPTKETHQFSSTFHMLFVQDTFRTIWLLSPVGLALAIRGRF